MVDEENEKVKWGTWEELILGGAVLRHGVENWDVVAKEVQTRTLYPFLFTPEVCKAKYEALQERYYGCSAWFEELRKRRVEELRRTLEMSVDSIGSLESKLVSLKTEKEGVNNAGSSCSLASPVLVLRSECNGSSGKEVSKDGSSASSFTHETQTTCSQQCQAEKKPVVFEPCRLERFPSIDVLAVTMRSEHGVSIKGRRGKRRRKDPREGSVGENNLVSQAKEKLTSSSDQPSTVSHETTSFKKRKKEVIKIVPEGRVEENSLLASSGDIVTMSQHNEKLASCLGLPIRVTDTNDVNTCTSNQGAGNFMMILDSIMENEHASVFRRRLDSQKRARYRSMVRQHMDLDTIRSRITNRSIKSMVELLRDLLLVANNALAFYSRMTREYKCAVVLRDLVTKRSHQYYKEIGNKFVPIPTLKSPVHKPPAKPRSARPFNRKPGNKDVNGGNKAIVVPKEGKPVPCNVGSASSAESSALTKKTPGCRGNVGRVKRSNSGTQAETPMKVRKKGKEKPVEKQ